MRVIIFGHFIIGLTSYGGLGATLALAEREWVRRRRYLSDEDVREALACARLLPGSAAVQLVSFLGFKLGGWLGSLAATLSFLMPSVLAMLALAVAFGVTARPPALRGASGGLLAATAGLLLATALRLGPRVADRPPAGRDEEGGVRGEVGPRRPGPRGGPDSPLLSAAAMAIALVAFASVVGLGANSALTVLVAGLLGAAFLRSPDRGRGRREGR